MKPRAIHKLTDEGNCAIVTWRCEFRLQGDWTCCFFCSLFCCSSTSLTNNSYTAMADHAELIANFVADSEATPELAQFYVEANSWDIGVTCKQPRQMPSREQH